MIRDSELSQFSLISCKKSTSFPLRRNRAEFENDYRQEITQKSKILNPDSKVLQPKTLNLEQISLETKQKLMDSNISHSSYNDVYINELKQHLILKSNQIQKYRRISEKIDTFLEQDEKYADCKTLKDVRKSLNDEYNCFGNDYYFFNSMLLPPSFHELNEGYQGKQVRIMKGILSEINCVYLFIDKTLFLWKYMDTIGNIEEITLQNIYNTENQNNAKVFSFGPYEEEIRSVNICRPSSHVFVQADIKLVFIIAFTSSIKLYNFLYDENTIALESLEVNINVEPQAEIAMISCSNSGRIFYGCSNGKVKEIEFQESKIFGLVPYKKGFYSKDCKKSIKSHLIDCFSAPYSIFLPPKQIKMISIDNTRYLLYVLLETGYHNENSEIVVYDLGLKNNIFKKIGSINETNLMKKLKDHGQRVDDIDSNELKIIHIAALDEVYSKEIHLLLITKNGARIFLTFLTKVDAQIEPYLTKYVSVERPTVKFEISFIKWPIILPNKRSFGPIGLLTDIKSTIASTQQSRNVIKGFLDHSNCLIIDSNEQKTTNGEQSFKSIYFYSLNLSKLALGLDHEMNNRSMNENAGVIKISTDYFFDEDIEVSKIPEGSLISSSVSNLLEYKRNGLLIHKEYFLSGKTGSFSYNCLNDLSRQVYLPASHYLFLSSECLDFVLKARPIDILFQILNIVNNETFIDEFEFNKFIACYGGIETCCMLLEIICNSDMHYYFNESLDKKLKTEYFIRIKQKQSKEKELFNQTTIQQQIKFIKASEENRVKAVNAFFKLGDSIPELKEDIPERRDFFEGYGRILQPEKKRYTYKIEGILLYFSRLIRPLWNKKIVNQSVFEHLIYDRLENFAEDELHLVRKRIMEIKNFMDSKNERLLIRQINTEDLNKAEKKAMFEFSKQQSFDNKYEFQESSNSNMLNLNKKNIEDVIWDEKKFMEDFYSFLERNIQTVDMIIFFVVNHNLRTIMNMIPPFDQARFLSLTFHELFREIDTEKPIKSLLSAFIKKNFTDSKTISSHFISHFPHFFTDSDSKITQAEQFFEISLKLPAENTIEREKYLSKALIFLHDNITYMTDEKFDEIYRNYLEKFGYYGETIVLLVKYINNLSLLEEGLKLNQKEINESKQIFGNKIEFYLFNIQQYKESSRNLILQIISRILITKRYTMNKSFYSFNKNQNDLIKISSLEELNILFEKCLKQIFLCLDENLHKKLISWMFTEKMFDEILAIESKSVEAALLEENDKNFKEKYVTLYKYYVNRADHLKASRTALRISLRDQAEMMVSDNVSHETIRDFIISEEQIIKMDERLKFMNFAIKDLENYLLILDSHEKDYAKHIEKKKDLILNYKHLQIQSKVIEELEEINAETKDYLNFYSRNSENQAICEKLMKEKIEIDFNISFLHRKVLDLEDLKTAYIEKYGMFACKLLIYDYAENEIAIENVLQIYETIIGNIYQDTLKTNLWKSTLQKKLKLIYFNLNQKRKKLFPLRQVIYILENYNQIHPCFSNYQENLINFMEKNSSNIVTDESYISPFWIPEFLNSCFNIKMIDLLRIYEKYFHENLDIYEKEIELMDIKGVALATNRNIENFIYALNVMLYVIELLLNSIQNNIQTLVSQAARKNVLEECQNNIRDFLEKENIVESLLFACFEKMNILRKLQHLDAKIIQVLELIIKKLSDEIKKINHQMSFVPFPPEQEYCEVGIPRKDINDREILQGSFRDSSSFVQEMPYMGQNLNFNAEVSGKKDPKFSKYDYTKTPI